MKLFTIGDSVSQGFMSLASARTDLSYSTLIAKAMGLSVNSAAYRHPLWAGNGQPLNIEVLLRSLYAKFGKKVGGPIEWPLAVAVIADLLDRTEDLYERGEGLSNRDAAEFFHNIAVWGFTVADAWQVTGELCDAQIASGERWFFNDGAFSLPDHGFYRTARDVLNPTRDPAHNEKSALDWLDHHASTDGVENLFLWLGSNNALGTVLSLTVKATNEPRLHYDKTLPHLKRNAFNLWSPKDFADDYAELMRRIAAAMAKNKCKDWHVFIGTVPAVTIAPIAKGVGDTTAMVDPFGVLPQALYYKYYTYVLFDEEYAQQGGRKLTLKEAYAIDCNIAAYNKTIAGEVTSANAALLKSGQQGPRYHVVPIGDALLRAAWKRNNGQPSYQFPPEVLDRYPVPDTRYYHVRNDGSLQQGGIFSLDGVHPSGIGHGLIAHEFLKVVNATRNLKLALDWNDIYGRDDLFMRTIPIMEWVRAKDQQRLAEFLLGVGEVLA